MSTEPTDPVVAMMLAERYGKSLWWKTPPSNSSPETAVVMAERDSDLAIARRRRVLLDAASDVAEEESA